MPNTVRSNGGINSLSNILAQLSLRIKKRGIGSANKLPASMDEASGVLSNASTRQQANGAGDVNNVNNNDNNKLTAELRETEKQNKQRQPLTEQIMQNSTLPACTKHVETAGYVGFASLPNQLHRVAVKRGFEFTLMVVGTSGLGKSTLINSMFLADIYNSEQYVGPSMRNKKTVTVEATKVLLRENGVNLNLTIVDTPGFGDCIDNTNCWVPIVEYIDSKYEEYLMAESRVRRKQFADNRIHCCLYFIPPTGHGLQPLDIKCMQRISEKVNLVPVIAKADTLTPDEMHVFKKQILNEIAQHKIKMYDFPPTLEDVVEDSKTTQNLRARIPFAVVGSNTIMELPDGKIVRGRHYPWGLVEVENLSHCDFLALRNMIIRTHLHALKEATNNIHYENYRCHKLSECNLMSGQSGLYNKNLLTQMEQEKREHEFAINKMRTEMEQLFFVKINEKIQKLEESEIELARRHEERKKMFQLQVQELQEKHRKFDQERKEWENTYQISLDQLKRKSLGTISTTDNTDDKGKAKKKKGLF